MLSSRACCLPQGEVFYDAATATARRVSRDAFVTGVTSVDVRAKPSLSLLCGQGVTASGNVFASMERPAHPPILDGWSPNLTLPG